MQSIISFKLVSLSIFSLLFFNLNIGHHSPGSLQNDILLGELKIEEIEDFSWFQKNYNSFNPNKKTTAAIAEKLKENNIYIEAYFGTWCSDSQYEVPSLIKLLHAAKFDMSNLKLVGVGRDKKVPNISKDEAEKLNVKMVPTFIFYKNGKEINRFVEFAQVSLEKDILSILKEEGYEHSYKF
jgi:thiol-disulfide isomerase/thioredoxin